MMISTICIIAAMATIHKLTKDRQKIPSRIQLKLQADTVRYRRCRPCYQSGQEEHRLLNSFLMAHGCYDDLLDYFMMKYV